MKALDELVITEYNRQEEHKKAKAEIAGLCSELGLTDSPYIRMLEKIPLPEVIQQIRADYKFEKQKEEVRLAREKAKREQEEFLARQAANRGETVEKPNVPNTIEQGGNTFVQGQNQDVVNALNTNKDIQPAETPASTPQEKEYIQKMDLEVWFTSTAEKEHFKATLFRAGFEYKKNYAVNRYVEIPPLTQEKLNEERGW